MLAPLVNEILQSLNREVINQLDLAASIKHPGESGRAREQVIANYLRRLVPKEFGIDTGFVFDAQGTISRQIDVVIYRTGYHPVFEIGGIKHFMIECVVAVLENKASIGSRDKLESAIENIASVKALDRTNGGTNYLVVGGQHGLLVNPDEFQHQVFGAIVTEHSLVADSLRDAVLEFLRAHPDRRRWPNIYADIRGVSAHFLKGELQARSVTVIPTEAEYLCITDTGGENYLPPLLDLTFELINFLRIAPIVDYKPTAYLGGNIGQSHWWKL
jgi:hypothetical protein